MTIWTYVCPDFECTYDGVSTEPEAPRPINCFCGEVLDDTTYYFSEEVEESEYQEKVAGGIPRPAWYKKRRVEIKKRGESPGGTLYCAICGDEIEVNSDGKEEWTSKKGHPKITSPNIDHYGQDWVERYGEAIDSPTYQNMSPSSQKQNLRDLFNASPLRVTHMICNCSRPKKSLNS